MTTNGQNFRYDCESLDTLDKAILKHETYALKLKSHRNTLIPISRLLPEILCRIFDFARPTERMGGVPSSLVALTHVCRSWRNLAIDCSTLWTDIAITSIPWTDEMLRRSRMSNMTIRATIAEFIVSEKQLCSHLRNLRVALTHMARIKELSIKGHPTCCIRVQPLLADLPVSAPVLESLTISMLGCWGEVDRCKLPPKALSDVDSLRQLQLSRCDVDWESPLFGQLTYLSVEDVSDNSRPSTIQLLIILQRLRGLRHLTLRTCLPIDGRNISALSPEEGSIHLPHLDSLVLSGKLVELEPWLRRMTIPSTSYINLQCDEPEPNVITRVLLNLLQVPPQSSGFTLKIFDATLLRSRASMVSITFGTEPGPFLTWASNKRRLEQTNSSSFLTEICNNLPVGKFTCLHFTSRASIDPQLIANTLGRLPCLESVLVFGEIVKHFIKSLTMTPATQSRSPSPLAFPQLRQISLNDVTFTSAAGDDGFISFESLRDCLIERYELGFEIEKVSVCKSSRLSAQDIPLLREIVPHVDWDGHGT